MAIEDNQVEMKEITGSDLYFREKIPVCILGATGLVGQRFVQLLSDHPWFKIVDLIASDESAGKTYQEAVRWALEVPIPEKVKGVVLKSCRSDIDCKIIFSALDASIAGSLEESFAKKGYPVISNAKNHRFSQNVPILIPEINQDQLESVRLQKYEKGFIVTNPNCVVSGLCLALKPLIDCFGVEALHLVTMQSISGAGLKASQSLDIKDNVIPFISGEIEKIEKEPLKIFRVNDLKISVQCNRIPVSEGHLGALSVKLKKQVSIEEVEESFEKLVSPLTSLRLPSSPEKVIHYFKDDLSPQPKIHKDIDKGMAVSIGQLKSCSVFDYKFSFLVNNQIRGAAGNAILIAELMVRQGYIFW